MKQHLKNFGHEIRKNRTLYLMILPTIIFFIVFSYIPMPGAYVAFVQYNLHDGIFGSKFVGLKNFEFLAKTGDLWRITRNTILYNLVFIVLGNFIQVLMAVLINEIGNKYYKKISQSIILLPYFISMVIVGYFAYNMFNDNYGFVNTVLSQMGLPKHEFYSDPGIWKYIIVFFKIWNGTGYGMIVYLATITGLDQEVYEAASLDGANAFQKVHYLTIPMLKPTIILLLMFSLGGILKGSFDLFYNLIGTNSVLYPETDIIDTYVFRSLVGQFNFSQGAAVGFYQSIFGLILVLVVNGIVRKIDSEYALF